MDTKGGEDRSCGGVEVRTERVGGERRQVSAGERPRGPYEGSSVLAGNQRIFKWGDGRMRFASLDTPGGRE